MGKNGDFILSQRIPLAFFMAGLSDLLCLRFGSQEIVNELRFGSVA